MANEKNDRPRVDEATATPTTGHEWDGLTELNTPLPRWWLWTFYLTIVWAVGYWVIYPSWPLLTSYAGGVIGWHSRTAVVADIDALKALRGPNVDKLTAASFADAEKDPALFDFTLAYGRVAFKENCAPCHGAGGGGAVGYANLIDDDWLWGGKVEDIQATIAHGIRNDDPDSRQGQMLAFGNGTLTTEQIATVANYVRSLSGLEVSPGSDLAAGAKIFVEAKCVTCHGPQAKGSREFGSANLTDSVWLYGSDLPTIIKTITYGRAGQMPSWGQRLDPTTIKALALYVHSLGGGE